ncbi:MAG: adenosine-specific kinase [Methanothrix sp.]|mgnify:CR=1 FL=1|jgi:adenosine/AMP kinase|nr:adenosine-specific kinase [Methanothrix sp.]OPX78369.1 MAG: Adenosine specific kinase [Methanosaeta sp. PtaB.Bin087]OPY50507.1 MAG: Adenosine specific kinase [Methanosaeta sp. PtaU1.Bin055]NLX39086.1 adenosine monophosphate-protein transferase [Methanothrix sp.]HNR58997.1 adenosine-specific kinase [Methanothrix sp.]
MEFETVRLEIPQDSNIILGQSHFIKTAEDLYEAIAGTAPKSRFGIAFSEASGPCLVRCEGNDQELIAAAREGSLSLGCGHTFIILIRDAFPINVLNAVKAVQEVCGIFCATANPLEVVVAATELGRGIMGVIDGSSPKGAETAADVAERRGMLRKFGYKL